MSTGDGRDGKLRLAMAKGALSGNLAGKSLPRQIFTIATWPLLEQLLSFLCASVSFFLAGHLPVPEAELKQIVSGIGVTGFVTWLGFLMQAGVSTGATALVSRLYGGRKYEEGTLGANQAAFLGLCAGMASTLLMFAVARFLVTDVLDLELRAQQVALEFLSVVAWVAVFSGPVFALNSALRGSGDTKTPFFVMLLVDGLTIGLSLLFVNVFDWRIAGLSWGMLLSWMIGAGLLFAFMLAKNRRMKRERAGLSLDEWAKAKGENFVPPLAIDLRRLWPQGDYLKRLLAVGVPQSLEVGCIWAIQFYALSVITHLGTDAVGGHMVAVRVESLSFLPGFAIGVSSAALVGQYLGSGSPRMALETMRKCLKYAIVLMGSLGIIFAAAPYFFASQFVSSQGVIEAAVPVLQVFLFAEPLFAAVMTMRLSLRGAGDAKRVMMVSFLGMGFFRVGLLTLWYYLWPDTVTLQGVWILFTVDMMVQTIILGRMIGRLKWVRKRV